VALLIRDRTMQPVVHAVTWEIKIAYNFAGMQNFANPPVNNKYWINTAEQSWESHHTDCLLAGIADPSRNYRLVKFGSR
jgi:hypothetical protein